MEKILVIGNVFESRSILVNSFCEIDNEVMAKKISSRVSGAAIVVSVIAAFLKMKPTLMTKNKTDDSFNDYILKFKKLGINTDRIDFSAKESNTLITIYDSHQDRKCYSYLPASIQTDDLMNIDYSIYDAVFFCCLPYITIAPIFEQNLTIYKTKSIIMANSYTSQYFYKQELRLPVNYIFCNRGELFSIFNDKWENDWNLLFKNINSISDKNAMIVVTLGKDGVIIADKRVIHKVRLPEIKSIVHPGGAGDAFATGFIYGILKKRSIEECCSLGHKCSEKMLSVYSVMEFIENELKE